MPASPVDEEDKLHDDTRLTHTGRPSAEHSGAVNPPVYHASTILFPTFEAYEARASTKVRYGRSGTPTTHAFEQAMATLERAAGVVLAPSGVAAISTALMAYAEPGAHFLVTDAVYGPVRKFCDGPLHKLGIRTTYYDPCDAASLPALIESSTRLIWLESPASQTFEIQDIPAIVTLARQKGITTIIDNSWSGGYFLKPLDLGVDISIQAATKYIGGHSDVMLGTIACNAATQHLIRETASRFGVCVGPDDAYLALRGLRTLAVRMRRHHESGLEMARFLADHPAVQQVLHPGLESSAHHTLWSRDFSGASGLFGFYLKNASREKLSRLLNGLQLYGMGASWGGFESLLIPANPTRLRGSEKTPGTQLMRIHVGLEDTRDLRNDLEKGLDAWQSG